MAEWTQAIKLGDTNITVINVGDIQLNLAEDYRLAEKDWPPGTEATFRQNVIIPMQCVLIQTPQTNVLVDATVYDFAPNSPFPIPGYEPPPDLLTRLAEHGVQPDRIAHVVITHTHFDHFNGTTVERNGSYEPAFPNARYYLARADWESATVQDALKEADSLATHTLVVLQREGLLELVSGKHDLTPEIQLIPAPGETSGHQIVRVSAGGQTFYSLGDLYHHPFEIEHPEWMSYWADRDSNLTSRRRLVEAALAEHALLSAAHIPSIGRLKPSPANASGVVWDEQTL